MILTMPLPNSVKIMFMNQPTILIAEDDPKTAELIRLYLEKNGYQTRVTYDGKKALTWAREDPPHLLILDIMLPNCDGLEVCRQLRAERPFLDIPIIMLTARSTEMDTLIGLDVGADDYITKPFSPREVVARVKTVLRRSRRAPDLLPQQLNVGNLSIYFERHEVWHKQTCLELTPREFSLLATLARSPERVFSREELATRAFGDEYDGNGRALDVYVMRLRKKIEPSANQPQYIQTVYGIGYKFIIPEEA